QIEMKKEKNKKGDEILFSERDSNRSCVVYIRDIYTLILFLKYYKKTKPEKLGFPKHTTPKEYQEYMYTLYTQQEEVCMVLL
ncbi:MAG: hypothetical protein LRY46_01805, partial [Candidatus Pacebacteria bacterium]|nr:hypothetical protein [Candidatus Paceibacterota bacterium]